MEEKITITKEEFLTKEAEVCSKITAISIKERKITPLSSKHLFMMDILTDFAALLIAELFDNDSSEEIDEHDCENCEYKDICEPTSDSSYKERLVDEYCELTKRREKLTEFLTAIEKGRYKIPKEKVALLKEQDRKMYEYLQVLEKRAEAEKIDLKKYQSKKERE